VREGVETTKLANVSGVSFLTTKYGKFLKKTKARGVHPAVIVERMLPGSIISEKQSIISFCSRCMHEVCAHGCFTFLGIVPTEKRVPRSATQVV
jgi:hypothetical protein